MSIRFKEIDFEIRFSYYFFDGMIKIKNLDPNKIKIDESHAKIFLFIGLDM